MLSKEEHYKNMVELENKIGNNAHIICENGHKLFKYSMTYNQYMKVFCPSCDKYVDFKTLKGERNDKNSS